MLKFSPASRKRKGALVAAAVSLISEHETRKKGNKKRKRLEWKAHVQDIHGEDIFRRAYRLTYDAFNSLLVKITPFITASPDNALNPSDSNVPPEICLASALRWLAGGQYIDICIIFGIGSTT
ncbi:MAG: hypothetical protein ACREBR_03985, partial [bacterium]